MCTISTALQGFHPKSATERTTALLKWPDPVMLLSSAIFFPNKIKRYTVTRECNGIKPRRTRGQQLLRLLYCGSGIAPGRHVHSQPRKQPGAAGRQAPPAFFRRADALVVAHDRKRCLRHETAGREAGV